MRIKSDAKRGPPALWPIPATRVAIDEGLIPHPPNAARRVISVLARPVDIFGRVGHANIDG